jgi:hypothetical protein
MRSLGWCRHVHGGREKNFEKKEQGTCPALKIVSTLFPRKIGFDLD